MTSQYTPGHAPPLGLVPSEPGTARDARLRPHGGPPTAVRRHNLPHLPSSFVGRDEDVVRVASLLGKSRLVTLTGPGGMGKTRLAIQVATSLTPRFADGVWLVELASLADETLLPEAVSAALPGRRHQRGPLSVDQMVSHIGQQSVLLVLDNCEHLVDPCGRLADVLLRSCPGLTVLATSREPLGVLGEHRWPVTPLSLPTSEPVDAASVAASEAGELFVQRAVATLATFELTDAVAPTVAEICTRLDGTPLAIELAASRLMSLSAAEVLERLDDRFGLLTTGSSTVVPRHQTLAATLEWSHDLLAPSEAALLRRVSIFAGWTVEAAEEVCAGGEVSHGHIVDLLGALAAKSLVVVETGDDRVRYHLLGTVREWARLKLDAASEADSVARRHALWCVSLAEGDEHDVVGSGHHEWLDQLDAEHDNLSAALEWARESNLELGIRLVAALPTFWRTRGHLQEGIGWLEWALDESEGCSTLLRAKVLRETGLVRGMLGDITSALPLLEESSELFADAGDHDESLCVCNSMFHMFRSPRRSLPQLRDDLEAFRGTDDTNKLAHFVWMLGQAHFLLGELSDARPLFEECVQLGREAADGEAMRSGLCGLGRVMAILGEATAAEVAFEEARDNARQVGDHDEMSIALGLLGDLARARGDFDGAGELLRQSARLVQTAASPGSLAPSLYFAAKLADWEGADWDTAESMFEEALTLGRSAGVPAFHEARCLLGLGLVTAARGERAASAGRFLEAMATAQSIGDDQASAQALDQLSRLARLDGKMDEAAALACRGLELHHRVGDVVGIASSLESVAGLAADREQGPVAARLLAAAQAVLDAAGYVRSASAQAGHERDVEQVRAALGAEGFAEAWAEGESLSTDDAVAYAMRGRGGRERPVSGWDSLTPAERQVAALVAEGLTNPDVGRRLFISPRTVGHHLAHVYQKLGIHSRGALIKQVASRPSESRPSEAG